MIFIHLKSLGGRGADGSRCRRIPNRLHRPHDRKDFQVKIIGHINLEMVDSLLQTSERLPETSVFLF